MEKNFKLVVEYDGTAYLGWQVQKTGPTVQGELEKAIFAMTRQEVRITGSGRTDTGVHALGQAANFRCETRLTARAFLGGLNSLLPPDIAVKDVCEVPLGFHARRDARSKTYEYRIANAPVRPALLRNFCWHIKSPLSLASMQKTAELFLGEQDFKSMEGAGSPRQSTVRRVSRSEVAPRDGLLVFTVSASGFLHHMVRNMAGLLAAAGRKTLSVEQAAAVLSARDRNLAPATAPAQGLFLVEVIY
ncbi:MAG: tRNA pseudouridine(38-40) synthase TruA [Thermodesulfobacteriota bacterium]